MVFFIFRVNCFQILDVIARKISFDISGTLQFPNNFYRATFHILASLGLHMIAKNEWLLNAEEYANPENQEAIFKKIKAFLVKHIK